MHVAVWVGMVVGPAGQSPGELVRHGAGVGRKGALQGEHDGWRDHSSTRSGVEQGDEVDGIFGDDDPVLGDGLTKHLIVWMPGKAEVADMARVMSEIGQVPGGHGAEHLVDEESHEARKRSRSWAVCYARFAAASLRMIIVSTSSG